MVTKFQNLADVHFMLIMYHNKSVAKFFFEKF